MPRSRLNFHAAEAKRRVAEHHAHLFFGVEGLGGYGGAEGQAHGAEGTGVEALARLCVGEDGATDVHGAAAFADNHKVTGKFVDIVFHNLLRRIERQRQVINVQLALLKDFDFTALEYFLHPYRIFAAERCINLLIKLV